jgi:UDP-2,3-diacylglucosamine pyrophosphatase LpxH
MAPSARSVFIISDLHLGGPFPDSKAPDVLGQRGFRMMTQPEALAAFARRLAADAPGGAPCELVINGDFVDFLAERHDVGNVPRWRPFIYDPSIAKETFERIAGREGDAAVFDALAAFVAKGHRLTVLLGNHDVELSLPPVRAALMRRLGAADETSVRFIFDGEALVYGDAIVEHGNLYDPANVVDHESLLRVRSLVSRAWSGDLEGFLKPPPGSELVARVMNPLKVQFPFIDLLKPESEPLFALLLALDPSCRGQIADVALALRRVPKNLLPRMSLPGYLKNVSGVQKVGGFEKGGFEKNVAGAGSKSEKDEALRAVLASALGGDEKAKQLIADADAEIGKNAAAAPALGAHESKVGSFLDRFVSRLGLGRLVAAEIDGDLERRLGMIQQALRAIRDDRTFDGKTETGKGYKQAAELLTGKGSSFRYVVFGHTHLAKDVKLDSGARYLNSGTWANLMRFPEGLLDKDEKTALEALRAFVANLAANKLDQYVEFRPTYVRLDLDAKGTVGQAELCTYDHEADKLS